VLVSVVESTNLVALEEVSELLSAYLMQTEAEKQQHAAEPAGVGAQLPERYQREVDDPGQAFATGTLLLARHDGRAIGVLAVVPVDATVIEIKRLWVTPEARGLGAGSALMRAALQEAAGAGRLTARLSVWSWRAAALATYGRLGFRTVPSWDARADLICMVCDLPTS
jgi:GNAT superfamily N-acetyltransferase